jgi:UDP-N-acetylglucosamine diphosphorylase/glucosamine-1-phosphate N-acetyltransferase
MYLCLFEDAEVAHLMPLAATRPVYDLRLGARTTIQIARDAFTDASPLLHVRGYLAGWTRERFRVPVNEPISGDVLCLNGRFVPGGGEGGAEFLETLRAACVPGEPPRLFVKDGVVVAAWMPGVSGLRLPERLDATAFVDLYADRGVPPHEESAGAAQLIRRLFDPVNHLRGQLLRDFDALTEGHDLSVAPAEREGANVHPSAILVEPERIYLGHGSVVRPGAILNASEGPIYIGAGAEVCEQAVLRGPISLGARSQVKIGASLEGSAFGPVTKIGGEVHSTIFHSYSNKGHAGFMGHSYVGSWCNFGADTNTSNLKNDYGPVNLWNEALRIFENTEMQFMGLVMADHSKCGINMMFNTGTVVGVNCNLYGAGLPPRHVPSFSWGTPSGGLVKYRLDKAFKVAEAVMSRRDVDFGEEDRAVLERIYTRVHGAP